MHRISLTLVALSLALPAAFAQQSSSSLISPSYLSNDSAAGNGSGVSRSTPASQTRAFPGIDVGAKIGLLGPGFEVAVPVAPHFNVRGGANFFSYDYSGATNGVNYTATLRMRSVGASLDWYPWAHGFRISPGALLYNGNRVLGNAGIPGGDDFTLNGTSYVSDPADPVHGTGSLVFRKAAPALTVGWGNRLSGEGRHVSFPFEAGFAYVGDPTVDLTFTGSVCDAGMQGCQSIANDPSAQANVAAERQKFQKDANYARFYPILSQGFAVRF
ncbi:MAG TPA: hypothetical protein VHE33_01995 [Acidobacteriaceae bacterium]|nr:hypothetical protein [Acidobacteriaceae bacterium]